jgi:3-hydroxybutyryl-CoA dehydrogenase
MGVDHIRKVAVIGMGTMGPDIAFAFARGGCQVAALGTRPESLDRARKRIDADCRNLVDSGFIKAEDVDAIQSGIEYTLDWDAAVSQADYVTEAVPENLEAKRQIFKRCGETCGKEVVVASNTSSISIDEIASAMLFPERAVITHWFIPAHIMPVVEVVSGRKTSQATLQLTRALLSRVGKRPVVCKENPGFVHNYIQAAMIGAAVALVEQGVCTAEDADSIVENGFALRLPRIGPLRMADYAGLDTALALLKYMYMKTRNPSFEPPKSLEAMVARGELGLKTGKGFYSYSDEEVERIRLLADRTVMDVLKVLGKV